MAVILLTVIYVAFIGLGVPDSLIGSAWPAVYQELGVPVAWVSGVTLTISGCTVLSGLFSDRLLNRFGTGKVTAVSTAMTAAALLGFSLSHGFAFLCLLAVPLGLGAGAIDAGLNNYIALHYKAHHMNYLHCFYGIGVACSPYVMSLALQSGAWRDGYRGAFFIQLAITAVLVLSLPLWKRIGDASADQSGGKPQVMPFAVQLKDRSIRTVWGVMLATNAIEYACGAWGSTWLVTARGFTPEQGAGALTLYYAGMALGRFLSGVISRRVRTWRRIGWGMAILLAAVVLLLLPLPDAAALAGLFLVGLGNGSIYPNFIFLTPYNFGETVSQSVMGSQIAAAYTGVMLTPPLFGAISTWLGTGVFPGFLLTLYAVLAATIALFVRQIRRAGRFNAQV